MELNKDWSEVLKSRRFWAMVIGFVVMLGVAAFPVFASAEEQIIESVTFIVLLLIGGYSLQDVALAWLARPGNVDLVVNATRQGEQAVESYLKIEIPDNISNAARAELQRVLQEAVAGIAPEPPQEVNIGGAAHGN